MQLVFKLRPGYEDVSGSVQYGPGGETFILPDDLEKGSVTTEDAQLQTALRDLQGAEGLVFDIFTEDGEPFTLETQGMAVEPHPLPEDLQVASPADAPAEHGDGSTYEGLTKQELMEEAGNRGLEVASGATKADLVTALEANDAKGGTSNGS